MASPAVVGAGEIDRGRVFLAVGRPVLQDTIDCIGLDRGVNIDRFSVCNGTEEMGCADGSADRGAIIPQLCVGARA